jgi:hypothetical protein
MEEKLKARKTFGILPDLRCTTDMQEHSAGSRPIVSRKITAPDCIGCNKLLQSFTTSDMRELCDRSAIQ